MATCTTSSCCPIARSRSRSVRRSPRSLTTSGQRTDAHRPRPGARVRAVRCVTGRDYCFGGVSLGGGVVVSDGGVVSAGGGAAVSEGEAGAAVLASPALPPGVVDWSPAPDGLVGVAVSLFVGGLAFRSLHPATSAPTAMSGISRFAFFMSPPGGGCDRHGHRTRRPGHRQSVGRAHCPWG